MECLQLYRMEKLEKEIRKTRTQWGCRVWSDYANLANLDKTLTSRSHAVPNPAPLHRSWSGRANDAEYKSGSTFKHDKLQCISHNKSYMIIHGSTININNIKDLRIYIIHLYWCCTSTICKQYNIFLINFEQFSRFIRAIWTLKSWDHWKSSAWLSLPC